MKLKALTATWLFLLVSLVAQLFTSSAFAILLGTFTEPGEYPMSVGIQTVARGKPDRERCSATFVRPNLVITAAHCIAYLETIPDVRIYSDGQNRGSYQTAHVKKSNVHPLFVADETKNDLHNDVGYIEFIENIGTALNITEYPTITRERSKKDEPILLVGTGMNHRFNRRNRDLPSTIKSWLELTRDKTDHDIFTLPNVNRASICDQDSGGSAFRRLADQKLELVGVIILGTGECGDKVGFSAVHDLTFSRAWLESEVGPLD